MSTELENPRFPVGLRVIVVDDDPLCLRIVEKMLQRCQYEGAAISCFFFAAGDATPSRERIECDVRARKTRGAGPSIVARGFGDSWCMETRIFTRQTRLRLTRVVGPASYPANEPPRHALLSFASFRFLQKKVHAPPIYGNEVGDLWQIASGGLWRPLLFFGNVLFFHFFGLRSHRR